MALWVKVTRRLINIQEVEIGQLTAEKWFLAVSLVRTWLTRDTIDTWPGKRDICHELSTCNWVTTGREADAVCTRRNVCVPFASGSVVSSVNANPTRRRPDANGWLESGTESDPVWTRSYFSKLDDWLSNFLNQNSAAIVANNVGKIGIQCAKTATVHVTWFSQPWTWRLITISVTIIPVSPLNIRLRAIPYSA